MIVEGRLRVLHVTGQHTGPYGPPELLRRLCESIAALGHEPHLSYVGAPGTVADLPTVAFRPWPPLARLSWSLPQMRHLAQSLRPHEIVHCHELWSAIMFTAGWMVPAGGPKLIVSTHGVLAPAALSFNRLAKRAAHGVLQHAIRRASLVVATSEVECGDVRRTEYRGPIAVIPHGVDGPVTPPTAALRHDPELLYLGRIHPIKGVLELLRAWALVAPRFPAWRLRLVGPGRDAHVQQARALAGALALPRVSFDGPLYGAAKSSAFFAADLAVAPSLAESFGVAIGEALAHGVPVVVSRAAPWAGVDAHACGWTTDVSVPALASTLNAALSTPRAALRAMGERGRAWVSTEFTWPAAAARMVDAYRWVLGRGPRPSFIRVMSD